MKKSTRKLIQSVTLRSMPSFNEEELTVDRDTLSDAQDVVLRGTSIIVTPWQRQKPVEWR